VGSSGKRRTTWSKLNRETKLRDKRVEKQARKAARRLTAASDADDALPEGLDGWPGEDVPAEGDDPGDAAR
jgi:hypothetical protein